jgi:hypothetical protein
MIASRNETGTAGRKVRLMARKDARNVKPSLSSDVRDKLMAAKRVRVPIAIVLRSTDHWP